MIACVKSQYLMITGVSCISLIVGYLAGKDASSDELNDDVVSSAPADVSGASKRSFVDSSTSSNSRGSRPMTAQGRADLALRSAKSRLDESSMVNMDFTLISDVWGMLDGLSAEELELVLAGMDQSAGLNQSNMMLEMMLLSRWGELDGKSAVEYVLSQDKKGVMKTVGLMGSLSSWIKDDPLAAELWFNEHKEEFKGGMFGSNVIEGMFINALAKKDLPAALAKMDLSKTSDRNLAVQAVSSLIIDPDRRDEVLAHVQGLDDEGIRSKMYEGMVQTLSYQDPDAAMELVEMIEQNNPDSAGDYRDKLLMGMRMHDPMAALEYCQTQYPEGEERDAAVSESFASLARQDSDAAREWMNANGKNNDDYLSLASDRLRWQNPDQAMEWALEISDDDLRTKKVVQSYEKWNEEHEAGAQAWLEQQDEDTQAAILAAVEEGE